MPTSKEKIVLDYIRAKENKEICDTAPFPECNGANGCDSCEYQEEETTEEEVKQWIQQWARLNVL